MLQIRQESVARGLYLLRVGRARKIAESFASLGAVIGGVGGCVSPRGERARHFSAVRTVCRRFRRIRAGRQQSRALSLLPGRVKMQPRLHAAPREVKLMCRAIKFIYKANGPGISPLACRWCSTCTAERILRLAGVCATTRVAPLY